MNKRSFFLVFSVLVLGLLSCENSETEGDSSLDGCYVIQKVEIYYSDGESEILTDKEDFSYDNDDILFDYEYVFSSNGTYSYRNSYDNDMVSGGKYIIKDGILSFSLLSILDTQVMAYKIVSNLGNTLVLEPTDQILKLNNEAGAIWGLEPIVRTVGTYKKQ